MIEDKLFRNIIIFVFGTVLNKGLNFFILPVMTYYLTKEDYGMLGVITSIVTISVVYIGFFPSNFIMVKFDKLGKEKMGRYISNILIQMFTTFLLICFVLYLSQSLLFPTYDERASLVLYIAFLSFFLVFWQQFSTIIQLEKDAIKYTLFQFTQTIAIIGLSLLLIIEFSWGWKGKFFAEMMIFCLSAGYALYYIYKNDYIVFDFDILKQKELFAFLFPLSFYVVGLYIMGTMDKILLANMVSLDVAGVYAIAITMSIVINIVFDAILRALEPYLFEWLNSEKYSDKILIVKTTYLFSLFIVFSIALYIFLAPYIFNFMIDEKFNGALAYMPILLLAYGFEGLRKPITEFLNQIDKVKIVGGITFLAAILNVLLNYMLIPYYGALGAAYATLISFFLLYIATLLFMLKYTNLPWMLQMRAS